MKDENFYKAIIDVSDPDLFSEIVANEIIDSDFIEKYPHGGVMSNDFIKELIIYSVGVGIKYGKKHTQSARTAIKKATNQQ